MKKLLVLALTALISSCMEGEDATLKNLKSPIIVVGIEPPGNWCMYSGAVTLRDSTGKIFSFPCTYDISHAISNSRKVGDTL